MSVPLRTAMWYASSWSGTTSRIGRAYRPHGDHPPAAGVRLLQVGERLFVALALRAQHQYRHPLVDQRDRAVLHLPGGVPFRVDVGDLLQLQRPFEGDGVGDAAAQVQEVAHVL